MRNGNSGTQRTAVMYLIRELTGGRTVASRPASDARREAAAIRRHDEGLPAPAITFALTATVASWACCIWSVP
jgi:hypothetical protein